MLDILQKTSLTSRNTLFVIVHTLGFAAFMMNEPVFSLLPPPIHHERGSARGGGETNAPRLFAYYMRLLIWRWWNPIVIPGELCKTLSGTKTPRINTRYTETRQLFLVIASSKDTTEYSEPSVLKHSSSVI